MTKRRPGRTVESKVSPRWEGSAWWRVNNTKDLRDRITRSLPLAVLYMLDSRLIFARITLRHEKSLNQSCLSPNKR